MIILSAERYDIDLLVNAIRTNELRQRLSLSGYTVQNATGYSAKRLESSFVIDGLGILDAITLASDYNQDSVLYVDNQTNSAYLVSISDTYTDQIGIWTKVDESEALQAKAWTRIGTK